METYAGSFTGRAFRLPLCGSLHSQSTSCVYEVLVRIRRCVYADVTATRTPALRERTGMGTTLALITVGVVAAGQVAWLAFDIVRAVRDLRGSHERGGAVVHHADDCDGRSG